MHTRAQAAGLPDTLVAPHFIAGRERLPDAATASRLNPAQRDDVVTLAGDATLAEVEEACRAARPAQERWARTPAPQRAQVLGRLSRLLAEEKEALSRFVAREVGKPLREARGSVQEAIDTAEFFQSEGRRLYGQTVPSELTDKELFTYRRPIGVVGVITAGNFPIAVPSWKLIPALLAGNAVVWKPSDDAPGTAALFLDLFRRAGLPDGVLSQVHGAGAGGAGEHLVSMVDRGLLDKISFTGSTAVGRRIGEICGRNLQVPSLELGGKNPLVILADADLELAIEGALWASFGTAGQRCTSCGNIIVDKRVMPEGAPSSCAARPSSSVGDPLDESVACGPSSPSASSSAGRAQRAEGLADGAELLLDGARILPGEEPVSFAGDASRGLFATPPHLRQREDEHARRARRVLRADGEPGRGRRLRRGYRRGEWHSLRPLERDLPRDAKAMLRFKEEIRAGMTSINNSTTGAEAHLPFGGNGWSGNGTRESGIWVIDAYTRWQA